ncbi:hypothetical protein LCGC14_2286400, partial [marine sediment metagenome]
RFKKQGNSLYVSHRVPLSFVQSAVYPLMVDVTVDEQVGAALDDAKERDNGTDFSTSGGVALHSNANAIDRWNGGCRYTTVAIGQADTIDTALWQPFVWVTTQDDPNTAIHANDVDDAVNFSVDADVTSRVVTAASVTWKATGIGTGFIDSPEIKTVIQEIVDRGGWASGNDMCIVTLPLATAAKAFKTTSYDGDTALASKLHVEFTAAGGETRSLAGSQPAATGVLARIEQGLRALAGNQPAATGTLARIEQALRALAGDQPAATGVLTRVFGQPRALTGDQPTPTGVLAAVWEGVRALAGSQPAATGTLSKKLTAFKSLVGDQPTAAGVLTRIEQALRALTGSQPNATGALTRQHRRFTSMAGNQPSAIGSLAASLTVVKRALAGAQPAATGALTRIEKAVRAIAGSQPTATGALSTRGTFARELIGSQPNATGALTRSKAFSRSLAGSQPAASGALSVVTLELLAVPDASARLADSIAGAGATVSGKLVGASAKENVHIPVAIAHRNGRD